MMFPVSSWSGLASKLIIFTIFLGLPSPSFAQSFAAECDRAFVRGDVTEDGSVDIEDGLFLLSALHVVGSPLPACDDRADADNSGSVNIIDALRILNLIFVPGTPDLPLPYPDEGYDEQAETNTIGWELCDGIDSDDDGIVDDGENCFVSFFDLFGGAEDDRAHDVVQAFTPSGERDGYVVVGDSGFTVMGDLDGVIRKYDASGDFTWQVDLTGPGDDIVWAIDRSINLLGEADGYILSLRFGLVGGASLRKIGLDGSEMWTTPVLGAFDGVPTAVIQSYANSGAPDGYIVTGTTSFVPFLMKVDLDGVPIWPAPQTYSNFGFVFGGGASDVVQTVDRFGVPTGFAIVGGHDTVDESGVYVIKTDPDGNQEWFSVIDEGSGAWGFGLVQSFDAAGEPDGYVIAGRTGLGSPNHLMLLLKIDLMGNEVWRREFDNGAEEELTDIKTSFDSTGIRDGYIVSGNFDSQSLVLRTNLDGDPLWNEPLPNRSADAVLQAQSDLFGSYYNGYVVVGETSVTVPGALIQAHITAFQQ